MDVVLVGRNELDKTGNHAYSKASVTSKGHLTVDANLGDLEVTEGTIDKVNVTDVTVTALLSYMLKELKKINLHLSLMTDIDIKNTEVE